MIGYWCWWCGSDTAATFTDNEREEALFALESCAISFQAVIPSLLLMSLRRGSQDLLSYTTRRGATQVIDVASAHVHQDLSAGVLLAKGDLAVSFRGWSRPHDLQPSSGLRVAQSEFFQQNRERLTQLEPVAGGVYEEESVLRNKASILDSSAASRSFSFFSSFKRFSLAITFSSFCLVRCSMS
jgi:hypothetical protein